MKVRVLRKLAPQERTEFSRRSLNNQRNVRDLHERHRARLQRRRTVSVPSHFKRLRSPTHPDEREVRDAEAGLAGSEIRRDGDGEVLVWRLLVLWRGRELGRVRARVEDVAQHLGHVHLGARPVRLVAVPCAGPEADGDGDFVRARQRHLWKVVRRNDAYQQGDEWRTYGSVNFDSNVASWLDSGPFCRGADGYALAERNESEVREGK